MRPKPGYFSLQEASQNGEELYRLHRLRERHRAEALGDEGGGFAVRYQVDFTTDIQCVALSPDHQYLVKTRSFSKYIYQTFTFIEKVGKVLSTLALFQLD